MTFVRGAAILSLSVLSGAARIKRSNVNSTYGSCAVYGCSSSYQSGDSCQCNPSCLVYNDCCDDYETTCVASCALFGCNSPYNPGQACQCNDMCGRYNNCCSDYDSRCNGPAPSPTPSPTPPPASPTPPPTPGVVLPPGEGAEAYWSGVNMQSASALQTRLRSGANKLSYSNLWNAYKSVWVNLPGKCSSGVYDIYSTKCWTPGTSQCGSYRKEGDCYNREHSWPKSWWNRDVNAAYSDMFHVMPSDGYVNGRRSSFPFGEVNNPTYRSSEGHKVGPCSTPGYSGTCFEPTDRTKGLVARGHLYMTIRYANEFNCCNKDGVSYSELKPWYRDLILKWHRTFPPEAWEQEFNKRAQGWQQNRNPFIDYPTIVDDLF